MTDLTRAQGQVAALEAGGGEACGWGDPAATLPPSLGVPALGRR